MSTNTAHEGAMEQHSIDFIPLTERHGKPWHLFTIWFSSNLQITGLLTGALAVTVGLSLTWAIITILVGNLVGAIFMAYHSVQGPRMGVPQMIQSRAQFGFLGALLPAAIVLCMYAGFAVEGGVVGGQALASWANISFSSSVIIQAAVAAAIAIVGYKLIHLTSRIVTVISTVLFGIITIALLTQLPANLPAGPPPAFGTVLLAISIFVSWQITWAPYVSDYSRYLPVDTPSRTTFAWTYIGSAIGGSWVMILGAIGASISAEKMGTDAISFLSGLVPGIGGFILLALLISVVPAGAYGAYGAYLTALSAISAKGNGRSNPAVRTIFVIVFSAITAAASIAVNGDVLATVQNITLVLLYLLVPWTAINLTDYYFVRKGSYKISELFKPRGIYGLVTWPAVIIYLVAIAAQIPFINSTFYVGPLVPVFGGADLAWIVGLLLPTLLYLGYARWMKAKTPTTAEVAVIAESDAVL